jgi:hypothetical protein
MVKRIVVELVLPYVAQAVGKKECKQENNGKSVRLSLNHRNPMLIG